MGAAFVRCAPLPFPSSHRGHHGPDLVTTDAPGESAFFELLLDHLCVAGFDGYWKRLNPSWSRTLGWTTRELMSRPLIEFVHPDDRGATLAARSRLECGESLLSLANRYRRKDGTYCWFEWKSVADTERQLVYAVARDVTAEYAVRESLRERTQSLAATLNSIADGVIATDTTGAVAWMNPVAAVLTRWSVEAAAGRSLSEVFEIVVAETHEKARWPAERTLQEGLASEGAEHTLLVARDGTELPIAFSRAPMKGPAGEITGAVIVFRDMSAEKRAAQEQQRLQRQLMFADRMASVGTLAAGVAHEINNPLAYVTANLDMILEDLRSIEASALSGRVTDWVEMASDAREGADRIRKIVRGLKTFSRSDEEHRTLLDVRAVLELCVDMTSNEIKHRARLVKDYGATPLVEADESRLGQVFVNLLVNAAQAIDAGGVDANEIRIVTSTDGSGRAVVEVRDTGAGIPEDVIGRIFDPFFTTKPVGVGTGLGLAITHGIVDSMGGQVTASNLPQGGAAFRVTMPAASGARSGTPAAHKAHSAGRRVAVLVVDDEVAIGVTLRRVLRDYDVTAVTSAKEALARIDAGAVFDIVISDVMMPEMSGMELYAELLRRKPSWIERIIFITGGAFTEAAHAFLDRVPNERLEKPFDASAVRTLVGRLAEASAAAGVSTLPARSVGNL